MTHHPALAIAALLIGVICIISANFVSLFMDSEISRKLSSGGPFEWNTWSRNKRIFDQYRRLYPGGRLNSLCIALAATGFALWVVSAWAIEILR